MKCIFKRHLSKSGIRRLIIHGIRARTSKITFQLTKHHRNEHDRYNIALHCELGVQFLIRSINFCASSGESDIEPWKAQYSHERSEYWAIELHYTELPSGLSHWLICIWNERRPILLQLTSASRSFLCGPSGQSQSAVDDWPMARCFLWFCCSAVLSGVVTGSFNYPYCLIITSTGVICAAKCTCTLILLHITRDYLTWEKIRVEAQGHHSICKQMSTQKSLDTFSLPVGLVIRSLAWCRLHSE